MSLQLQRPVATTNVVIHGPQVQKTAAISAGTIATQVQSAELTMIGLYCWMSEFCFSRKILKKDCFEPRPLDDNSAPITYHEWSHGPVSASQHTLQDLNQQPVFIRPGSGRGADLVLHWLEQMNAHLKKGNLQAVIVQVLEDETRVDHVLEQHTSSIWYGDNSNRYPSAQEAGKALSVASIRSKIREYGWEFMLFGLKAPRLPEQKHVRMIMILNDEFDVPDGFARAPDADVHLPRTDEWHPTIVPAVELISSHHAITTEIACLNYVGSQGIATIPSGLQYVEDSVNKSSQAAHEEQIRHDLMHRFGSPAFARTQVTESDSSLGQTSCLIPRSLFAKQTPANATVNAPPLLEDELYEIPDSDRSTVAINRKAAMARLKNFPDVEDFMPLPKLKLSRLNTIESAPGTQGDTSSTSQSTGENTTPSGSTMVVVDSGA